MSRLTIFESRAEQSRAEQSRAEQIDVLKAICAFLIVCIHSPFKGMFGEYFTVIARIAVPVFFMITGYFYSNVVSQHREKQQIKKILYLVLEANVLYFLWNIVVAVLNGNGVLPYLKSVFSYKSLLNFFVLNVSPFAAHLWYLGAILYVLFIIWSADKLNCRKVLYGLTPILLAADIVFGKYSLLVFDHEFPYVYVRNFLCVGIPYFCIGLFIREKCNFKNCNKYLLKVLIIVFGLTGLAERYCLVNAGLNATRDHYISTTLLAVCLFIYAINSNWNNKYLAVIGKKYSTWLYIVHPIFITVFASVSKKLGIETAYSFIAPILVYCGTILFLIVAYKVWVIMVKKLKNRR